MLLRRLRLHRRVLAWLVQPATGWLVLAGLYLVAAVLTLTMSAGWPLVLVTALVEQQRGVG